MKKIGLIICGLFTLLAVSVKAAPITESDAKSVAEVFCAIIGCGLSLMHEPKLE